SGNLSALKSRCGFEDGELREMLFGLKNAFSSVEIHENLDACRRIDLIIEEKSVDEFHITMDGSTSVDVEFDGGLYAESLKRCRSENDKAYMVNNAAAAKLLVKSINCRNSTLLKIAREIAHRQCDFFSGKDLYLTPISAKSISYSLFLHESTINRAILNKSVSTPRGIFELRSLIPREIKSDDGKVSDHSVKEYMKQLIVNEPPDSPYSDKNIVSCLGARGINISRRTVSKYRSILNIPSCGERTKIYKIAANI
ncbi:MAG: hypothetical protein LBO02_03310, partial [Holosporaceae bacterium]|nr:hypothetical protein [Holosporaceae bacterium]